MIILYFKSLHIIGFVAWFAGLFYLVRMFVYHVEAMEMEEPKRAILIQQYELMESRVYHIICNPGMMLTFTFGIGMLVANPGYFSMGWMHIKLTLLALLLAYHIYCKRLMKRLESGEQPYNSFQFRLLNEVPTLFLVSIVLLAVLKSSLNFVYAFAGILAFGFLLYWAARLYKRARTAA